jgi:hypothetical protein
MKPSTRIRIGAAAILRTRRHRRRRRLPVASGYAALRRLRRLIRNVMADHRARSLDGARSYGGGERRFITLRACRDLVRELLRRWPELDLTDPRGQP